MLFSILNVYLKTLSRPTNNHQFKNLNRISEKITLAYSSLFSSSSCFCAIVTNQPTSYIYIVCLLVAASYRKTFSLPASHCCWLHTQLRCASPLKRGGKGWAGQHWFFRFFRTLPPIYTGQIQHHHHPCSGSTFQNMAATFECSSSRFSRFLQRKTMISRKSR